MTEQANQGPPWRAAEERVASLYRALGFTVARDVLVQGTQIDVVAEQRMGGLGQIRVAVEVKDHPTASLPIDEVRKFAATAQLLTGNGEFDQMHLVTTASVSRNSRDVIKPNPRARLMTYEELERELFNPDAALGRWLEQYRSKPINQRYVEVQATLLDLDTPKDVEAIGRLASTSLLDVQILERLDGLEWRLGHASGSHMQRTPIAPAHDVDVIQPAAVLAEIAERTRLTREVIERLGDKVNYELPSEAGADLLVRRGNRAWVFQFKCGPIDVLPSFNNVVSVAKRLHAQPVLVVSPESHYLSAEPPVGSSEVLISSEGHLIELLESVVSS